MTKAITWGFIVLVMAGCGKYSFTGTNITAESISVSLFFNDTGQGPANLSQQFTEELRDYYQSNTSLAIVPNGGELQVEGSIVNYFTAPVAPVATGTDLTGDVAGATRLTIEVEVSFINTQNEEEDFNRRFRFYADFDSQTTTLTAEEDQLIETIFDQITFDIFNATVANW